MKIPAVSPRWLIYLLDILLSSMALGIAFRISNPIGFYTFMRREYLFPLLFLLGINAILFFVFRLNKGIIRYTGVYEIGRLLLTGLSSTGLLFVLHQLFGFFPTPNLLLFLLGYFTLFVGFLGIYRTFVRYTYFSYFSPMNRPKTTAIYGAGDLGAAMKAAIDKNPFSPFKLVQFIDDHPKKKGKRLDGVMIADFDTFAAQHAKTPFDVVILAMLRPEVPNKARLIDFCLEQGIQVLKSPPTANLDRKPIRMELLQQIRIEDLLERDPIRLDKPEIRYFFGGKRVLVTGAAGSIGSELVRQILGYGPQSVVACDQAETPLHELMLELEPHSKDVALRPYLASVTDERSMRELFRTFRPDYVFHAAAYKHVPMMEQFPTEAVRVNIFGTRLMADLALEYGAERFVMVSTDKAVNPTNVMGASKRLAEIYVQGLSQHPGQSTRFITTRFGNVLGSNGSVVHRFQAQIEAGGPVTVTHPEINRYFMLIPEACQLVLEAASMGSGGEVFAFDMGNPVKIADLAKKMIRLYGLKPDVDIPIQFVGLRPGEKLFEEVLSDQEKTLKTYHEKIYIALVRPVDIGALHSQFENLQGLLKVPGQQDQMVAFMKELVPEFISNNSSFEALDKPVAATRATTAG